MTALLELVDASLRYGSAQHGVHALREISLRVHAGERLALVGANGCGKSTLLRMLHGLVVPTAGTVWCEPAADQAMLFQHPHLLRLSVQNNVAMGLWLRGTPWAQARTLALEALHRVGLSELAQRPARKLSGGQQQRVALSRAWALQPQVLLLDEPTASLDPHAKREVETLVGDYVRQRAGMALIFASHNLGQVKRLASRVVYLEQGRLLADLPVDQFFGGTHLQTHYPEAYSFIRGESA
jgi:tungstate transport system ATP-binding protein